MQFHPVLPWETPGVSQGRVAIWIPLETPSFSPGFSQGNPWDFPGEKRHLPAKPMGVLPGETRGENLVFRPQQASFDCISPGDHQVYPVARRPFSGAFPQGISRAYGRGTGPPLVKPRSPGFALGSAWCFSSDSRGPTFRTEHMGTIFQFPWITILLLLSVDVYLL